MAKSKILKKIIQESFSDYLSCKNIAKVIRKDKPFFVSPSFFKSKETPLDAFYDHKNRASIFKDTMALLEGSAFHLLMSEPELFAKEFAILNEKDLPLFPDNVDFRKTANRNFKDEFTEQAKMQGKKVILNIGNKEKDQLNRLYHMRDSMLNNIYIKWSLINERYKDESISQLLEQGLFERSFYTKDEETGLLIKFRPDWDSEKRGFILDFKTTKTADWKKFYQECMKYGYDQQAAFYCDFYEQVTGIQVKTFWFALVEKTKPYKTEMLAVDMQDDFIMQGRIKYRRRLNLIAESIKEKKVKGYSANHENDLGFKILRRPMADDYIELNW